MGLTLKENLILASVGFIGGYVLHNKFMSKNNVKETKEYRYGSESRDSNYIFGSVSRTASIYKNSYTFEFDDNFNKLSDDGKRSVITHEEGHVEQGHLESKIKGRSLIKELEADLYSIRIVGYSANKKCINERDKIMSDKYGVEYTTTEELNIRKDFLNQFK